LFLVVLSVLFRSNHEKLHSLRIEATLPTFEFWWHGIVQFCFAEEINRYRVGLVDFFLFTVVYFVEDYFVHCAKRSSLR
jgi:hypothetical protein